ncbi:MAG: MFS transporter [Burkholderiaceae bacterium]|jgi:MFS family permease|nr:MFS transporter [Burkholderiaceae bacterium]
MRNQDERDGRGRWALPVLTGAYVLSQFFRSYVAVIATQLIDEFGFTPQMFGWFAGAFYFTFALVQLPLGVAFDRFGVRTPVLLCIATGSVGALVLPLTHSVPLAMLAHVALGIGCAPLYMGLLNHVLKSGNGPEQVRIVTRASALGYLGAIAAGLPLAWGVASVGWRASLLLVGVLMAMAAVGIALTLRDVVEPAGAGDVGPNPISSMPPGPTDSFQSKLAFAALLPVCFALIAGGTFRMSWGGPYLADLFGFDVVLRGYVMTGASVLAMCWALGIAGVVRRIGAKALVLAAFGVGFVAAMILVISPAGHAWLGALLVCVLFCVGSIHPVVMSQARSVVPPAQLGLWLGVLNSMVFLGVAASNAAFGWIAGHAEHSGMGAADMYSQLFAFTAGVMVLGWLGAVFGPGRVGHGVRDSEAQVRSVSGSVRR